MPFQTVCTNKGCHKSQEPYLDPKNDKVYCSKCEQEINNITHFAKMQMKTLKQFKPKNTTSFSIKCLNCGREGRPQLTNNDVVCSSCQKPLNNLSVPFKNMLKEQLKTVDKEL